MKKAEMQPYKDMLIELRARLRGDVNAMADAALKKTRSEANGDLSSMPIHMADLVQNALQAQDVSLQKATVTILGIAYLENSDDTRNTPSAVLAASLQSRGVTIILHDPYVKEWEFGTQEVETDILKAAKDSDCLVLVTKHSEYYSLNLDDIKKVMRTPIIVDGRNVFDMKTVLDKGFEYRCVGKSGIKRS